MADRETVSYKITIGDQTFRIRISPEEKDLYDRVARFTEASFKETSRQSVSGGAQVWAMTAFQIACELMDLQDEARPADDEKDRIQKMIQRIEEVTSEA